MSTEADDGGGFDIGVTMSTAVVGGVKHMHARCVHHEHRHTMVSGSGEQSTSSTSGGCGDGVSQRQVVLITGCSSGIGRATALHFAARGWAVCATLRDLGHAEAVGVLEAAGCSVHELDVTDSARISGVIGEVAVWHGRLDAVVCCAGQALVGALELCTYSQWMHTLSVNVAGPLSLIGAALPYLRAAGGVAVLVSSALGASPLPLTSGYGACKAALDGATQGALAELKAVGVRLKVVVPGRVSGTQFISSAERTGAGVGGADSDVYGEMTRRALEAMQMDDAGARCSTAEDVGRVLWEAVTDGADRVRYVVGADAQALLAMRRAMGDVQLRDELMARFGLHGG